MHVLSDRLKDYPQYCQHLASISHFIQFPHHLQEVSVSVSNMMLNSSEQISLLLCKNKSHLWWF